MFQALEEANHSSSNPNSARGHRGHDSTIGIREIDMLNKQFQEQMAERVKDLEMQVMTKE